MIGFAACVGTPAKLAAYAAPGLARAMEPDSVFAERGLLRACAGGAGRHGPSAPRARPRCAGAPAPRSVDCVDGLLMVLSPWAVANLRCDTRRFSGFHAYDADLCFQALAAGRRVTVADLAVFHHTKGGYGDAASFAAADAAFRAKWGEQQVDQQLGIAADALAHDR